jgi:hypothetical protein
LPLSFLRKFRVSVEGATTKDIEARVPQGSVLSPTLYSLYINDTPQTPGVYLGLFADDTCIYTTDRKEGYVLRKLQRGLSETTKIVLHLQIELLATVFFFVKNIIFLPFCYIMIQIGIKKDGL